MKRKNDKHILNLNERQLEIYYQLLAEEYFRKEREKELKKIKSKQRWKNIGKTVLNILALIFLPILTFVCKITQYIAPIFMLLFGFMYLVLKDSSDDIKEVIFYFWTTVAIFFLSIIIDGILQSYVKHISK